MRKQCSPLSIAGSIQGDLPESSERKRRWVRVHTRVNGLGQKSLLLSARVLVAEEDRRSAALELAECEPPRGAADVLVGQLVPARDAVALVRGSRAGCRRGPHGARARRRACRARRRRRARHAERPSRRAGSARRGCVGRLIRSLPMAVEGSQRTAWRASRLRAWRRRGGLRVRAGNRVWAWSSLIGVGVKADQVKSGRVGVSTGGRLGQRRRGRRAGVRSLPAAGARRRRSPLALGCRRPCLRV